MHKKADERKSINACVNLSANNFCITFSACYSFLNFKTLALIFAYEVIQLFDGQLLARYASQ